MHKRVLFCFLILFLLSGIQCGLFEPENGKGSVRIHPVTDTGIVPLAKTQESLSSVRCVLKKGSDTVHDQNHSKVNGSFQIDIEDLDPGDDYSILLYGKNSSGDIIGRGYRDNISVTAGDVAIVSISWSRFNPTLVSPANGSTTSDHTPTFDWSSVSGISIYALEVDNSNSFSSLEVDQSNLASSDYTPSTSLADGTYYWRVRSKDSQGNWGGWSVVWSFTITSGLTVTSPNGGETWYVVDSHNITWTSSGTSGNVKIEYSTNGGSTWTTIISSTMDDGTYSWTVPDAPSSNCYVKVADTDGSPSDQSNSAFTIQSVGITVVSPNGGEVWYVGESHNITWTSSGTSGNVKIEYSTNDGSTWTTIISSTTDDGTYSWTVPNAPSSNCYVKIADTYGSPSDQNNSAFTIQSVGITVVSPNGGEVWYVGESHNITWTSSGTSGNVKIEYSTNDGSTWTTIISSTTDDGTYSWTVPNAPSSNCYVKITDTDGSPSDQSNSAFTIQSVGITVVSPNGGEVWYVGESHNITWTSSGTSGNVKIEYSTNGGSTWTTIISSTTDDGTYSWTVPNAPSSNCYVKIADTDGSLSDQSNSAFTISSETGTVTDIDGNVYQTIKIGDQWWMMENLRVTHYRNGDEIPNVIDNTEWTNLWTGARCDYDTNSNNVTTYGRLYNWYAVNDSRGGLAIAGWHVPSDAEWQTLVDYFGGDGVAGGKLKEAGTSHWQSPNAGATNESGFSALPGGYRYNYDGGFYDMGRTASFWSATEDSTYTAWGRKLYYYSSGVYQYSHGRKYGFSVRLVRD